MVEGTLYTDLAGTVVWAAIAFGPDRSLVVTSEGGRKKSPATFARLTCTGL